MEVESNVNKSSDNMEVFTEQKFAIVIEEVDVPLSPALTNTHEGQSLCPCAEEVKYLKETVKLLTSQVNQQNLVITGIKSGLRNAVLSLSSCYTDDKNVENTYNTQGMDYVTDHQVNTVSGLGTNFEVQISPQVTNHELSEPIPDPLQEEISCPSIPVVNSINSCENIINDPIVIPSCSLGITLENELNEDEDVESNCDMDDNEDELYAPSENDINSDQDLDDDDHEKNVSSSNSKTDANNVEDEEAASSREVFQCTKCPKEVIYKTRRTLKEHMRRYHSKNPHKCHLCEKFYVKSSSLAHHIHSVHERNRLKCAYCPGSFVQLGKLRVHEKIHLEKDGPPLQCCEYCGMNFRTIKSLLAHLGAMHKDTDKKHYAIGVKAIKNKHVRRK